MINKDDLLNSEFLKQFKNSKDFSSFMEQLYKRGVEKMLEGELAAQLGYDKHDRKGDNSGNSRNGKTSKTIKSEYGQTPIEVPRDRNSEFEPVVVPKRSHLSQGIEQLVISLYAKGMSNSDIEEQLKEVYDFRVSTSTISKITDKVQKDIVLWQNRPLESVYYVVWLDGMVFKVRQENKVVKKTLYLVVGLTQSGYKEILGLWLGGPESASYWMNVLTELKTRVVEDILITCTNNLTGFTEAINSVFPKATTQICVVHQIRNSTKYVVWKDKKAFSKQLKEIYTAVNKESAALALD